MSFSREVKNELSIIEGDKCCLTAELAAIIRGRSECALSSGKVKLIITTKSLSIARRIVYLIKKLFEKNVNHIIKNEKKLDKKDLHLLIIEDSLDMLKKLNLIDDDYTFKKTDIKRLVKKECCKQGLVRGYFLMRGSCNDPKTSRYHFEIVVDYFDDALMIKEILSSTHVHPKIIERQKGFVLYLKKAEEIGDILRFMGAINSSFSFEDERIRKDYGNYVNRIMNCDIANQQKAIRSAALQLENIKILDKYYGLANLTERLRNAIILRNTFPDDSLNDLSEKSYDTVGKYISKPGLSHCFSDIKKLADEYRK